MFTKRPPWLTSKPFYGSRWHYFFNRIWKSRKWEKCYWANTKVSTMCSSHSKAKNSVILLFIDCIHVKIMTLTFHFFCLYLRFSKGWTFPETEQTPRSSVEVDGNVLVSVYTSWIPINSFEILHDNCPLLRIARVQTTKMLDLVCRPWLPVLC